jgi:hypothetical protein
MNARTQSAFIWHSMLNTSALYILHWQTHDVRQIQKYNYLLLFVVINMLFNDILSTSQNVE